MSDLQTIEALLQRTARRMRRLRAWQGFWIGLAAGGLLWCIALLVYKILPIPNNVLWIAGIAGGLVPLTGIFAGALQKIPRRQVARWLDERAALQERLATALEVSASPSASAEWQQLLVSDAATRAGKVESTSLLPFQLPRASRWALLILIVGVGLGFVPEYRTETFLQRERERENVMDTGRHLADLTRRNLQNRPPALEPTREAIDAVAVLGDQLSKNPLTRSDALRDLASITEKIKNDMQELGRDAPIKPLERAARDASRTGSPASAEMQRQIESLQKSLGEKASKNPAALDQLKQEVQKAKQAASGLASQDSPEAAAARQQLAQTLADLASQSREMGQPLAGLEDAIAALQASDLDRLLRDLDMALDDLNQLEQMAKALEKLQQQLAAKVGRDLAEQLQKGQAQAAIDSLGKMIQQLQSSLTPEQLQNILAEVSKAVDPAGEYGEVAGHLKRAAGQLGQSEPAAAAQSLADAARELQRLLDMMGDAQALAATLDLLKHASLCIGSCQGWGQCQGPPAFGPGGKPGSGVGTWADEAGWMYLPEVAESWDNSGVERPDMEGRGETDRGEGEISDKLLPTKVRGQFTPGGPMPSITLKGLSIKGESTVGLQEALTGAQTDAQSALNQDQVPRAYQGAVRDYFDDLKE